MTRKEIIDYIELYLLKNNKLNIAALRWGKADYIKDEIKYDGVDNIIELLYLFYYQKNRQKCECGNFTKFISFTQGYLHHCSNKCAQSSTDIINKKKQTSFKKYGTTNPNSLDEIKNKIKNNNIKRYGVISPNAIKEVKEKKEKTSLERYGVKNPMQCNEIKNRANKTNIEKYGIKNPNSFGSERFKNIMLKKYGIENNSQLKSIKEKKKFGKYYKNYNKLKTHNNCRLLTHFDDYIGYNEYYNWECLTCKTSFKAHYYSCICPVCFPNNRSKQEQEIVDYIKSFNINVIENTRTIINPKELDIYIPDYKIAIEYNGLYWHSELNGKDKNYHLNKTLECEKQGIRLIHIFENEWINKQEIVKSRLRNIFGKNNNRIGARKTTIKEIDTISKNNFLEMNHIQGSDKSTVKLGAFYNNKLIGVMTFSMPRIALGQKNKKGKWELSRFATIADTYTPGLAGKMLKYFENNYKWNEIYSYADRRWSQGNLYKALNFNFDSFTSPNYWYFYDTKLYHRYNFRKNVLNKKLESYESNLSEWENMQLNGWDRIYDCGSYKFVKSSN